VRLGVPSTEDPAQESCLEYRDAERLEISADCGLRRVPRYLAISKMSAAAEAARRLRATG
jgi:5-methyltetrahydropteroyltriglutamate--homocysteine methyltransferase